MVNISLDNKDIVGIFIGFSTFFWLLFIMLVILIRFELSRQKNENVKFHVFSILDRFRDLVQFFNDLHLAIRHEDRSGVKSFRHKFAAAIVVMFLALASTLMGFMLMR